MGRTILDLIWTGEGEGEEGEEGEEGGEGVHYGFGEDGRVRVRERTVGKGARMRARMRLREGIYTERDNHP